MVFVVCNLVFDFYVEYWVEFEYCFWVFVVISEWDFGSVVNI